MTADEAIDAAIRERRAVNAGIAKAALWLDETGESFAAKKMLREFGLTADDLRNADAVERIEHFGRDVEDLIELINYANPK